MHRQVSFRHACPVLFVGSLSRPIVICSEQRSAVCKLTPSMCATNSRRPARKPKGYWSDINNVKRELSELQVAHKELRSGCLPTARELRNMGRRDLDNAITKMGGYRKVAELLGLAGSSTSRPRGYWSDFANLESEIRAFLKEHKDKLPDGKMPTQKELRALRRSDIVEGLQKHGGSAEVAARLGLAQRAPKKSKHYWKEWSRVEAEVRTFVANRIGALVSTEDIVMSPKDEPKRPTIKSTRQRMPSQKELRSAGRADLAEAITDFHGGFREVAKRLGYLSNKKDDFFYDNFHNVAREVYAVVLQCGQEGMMPSTSLLKAAGRSDLSAAIARFGGMSGVSQRLGLQYKVRAREAFKDWNLFRRNLMAFMDKHGVPNEIPSSRTLSNFGRDDLSQAILHHGGSRHVADKMGLKRNYWQDFSNVGMQVLEFVDTHGTEGIMPTETDFIEVGRSALELAVSKFGYAQVAKRLGLTEPPQSTQFALDALLNQSASLAEVCCEDCEEQSDFLF